MPHLWWKWLDDVRLLLQGREGRQNFINTLTDTKTSNIGIKTFFINDTMGDARFTDPVAANEPYVGPNGEMIVPGTVIATKRQINNVGAVRAYQTVPQTFFSGAPAVLTYNATAFDEDSGMSAGTGTFTPKQAGKYLVTGTVGFPAAALVANKSVSVGIAVNGTTRGAVEQHTSNIAFPFVLTATCLLLMNGTTDYVQVSVQQNFGVNAATIGAEYAGYMTAFKVD
jgi:hypothetical protein